MRYRPPWRPHAGAFSSPHRARASSSVEMPFFDDMSSEAKSLLGVFLDFNRISREKLAKAWSRKARTPVENNAPTSAPKAGPLFAGAEARSNSGRADG